MIEYIGELNSSTALLLKLSNRKQIDLSSGTIDCQVEFSNILQIINEQSSLIMTITYEFDKISCTVEHINSIISNGTIVCRVEFSTILQLINEQSPLIIGFNHLQISQNILDS